MNDLSTMFDDAAGVYWDHQERLIAAIGDRSWACDLEAGTLTFSKPGTAPIVMAVQILGTESSEQEWLWSWANPGIPEECTAAALSAREAGKAVGVAEFTQPTIPVTDRVNGMTLSAVVAHGIGNAGVYRGPTGTGATVYFLVFLDAFGERRPRTALEATQVFMKALMGLSISSHERALVSYLTSLGARPRKTANGIEGALPDAEIIGRFDAQGRIIQLGTAPLGGWKVPPEGSPSPNVRPSEAPLASKATQGASAVPRSPAPRPSGQGVAAVGTFGIESDQGGFPVIPVVLGAVFVFAVTLAMVW